MRHAVLLQSVAEQRRRVNIDVSRQMGQRVMAVMGTLDRQGPEITCGRNVPVHTPEM